MCTFMYSISKIILSSSCIIIHVNRHFDLSAQICVFHCRCRITINILTSENQQIIHTRFNRKPANSCIKLITCNTEAPAWRNCSAVSAESMPPVARIGKPGIARAMADTALRAMGLMALPVCMNTKVNAFWSLRIIYILMTLEETNVAHKNEQIVCSNFNFNLTLKLSETLDLLKKKMLLETQRNTDKRRKTLPTFLLIFVKRHLMCEVTVCLVKR